jgi:serine protease
MATPSSESCERSTESATARGRPSPARSRGAGSTHRRRCALLTGVRAAARVAAAAAAGVIAVGTGAAPASAAPAPRTGAAPASAAPAPRAVPTPLSDDAVRAQQWQLKTLDVAAAWTYASGQGVTVAVVDSGVDATHVDLAGQVLPGADFVDPGGDGDTDLVGHGTTVAAIIAGRGDDSAGVEGIAPKARILPVRVLDQNNRYDDAMIVAKGVRWAVDHGARVINLSLGGNGSSAALAAALDYAFARDVVVVACTGNVSPSSPPGVWYPAREPGVLAVAGMERDGDVLWSGSITGPETVVTAPATQIVGARPSGYWKVQGTSFAAPMVSATAALIRSRWPTMSAAEVINRIIRTARDRGAPGRDSRYGFGIVDPGAALTADVPDVATNPLDTTPPPGVTGFGSAPASGQALSAPYAAAPGGPASVRASGANAGQVVASESPRPASRSGAWWLAGLLLVLSLLAGVFTVRRLSTVG